MFSKVIHFDPVTRLGLIKMIRKIALPVRLGNNFWIQALVTDFKWDQ